MKYHLLVLCIGVSANPLLAAEDSDYRPFNIGVEVGTTGPGILASWRFHDHFGVRGGFNYFRYESEDEIEEVEYDSTLRLMSEPLTLNYYPWRRSSFHISAGVLFNQNRLTGTGTRSGIIDIGDNSFPADQVGRLDLEIEHKPVSPYLSIGGNLYFGEAKHWSLGGELGVFYTGSADVSLRRSGGLNDPIIDAAVEQERQEIEDYTDDLKFWPVAKISLNFSF